MKENSRSDRKNKNLEKKLTFSIYVPEEQRIQRIPLCQYLSDLESLFENDTAPAQEKTEGKGEPTES